MDQQFLTITWTQYHHLAQKLAAAMLKQERAPVDEILAISRGGLTLGHMLADFLRIPIASITIQSYTDIKKQGEVDIRVGLTSIIKNKRILLVDDIADSGKTLTRAVEYLKQFQPAAITTVTMFYKPQSIFRPDYFSKSTKKWILQPFEVTEWVYTFSKKLEKEGKSKTEIQSYLEKLGYTTDQIRFVRRHHLI